ncbi:hypothetical protein D3C79_1012580 [compost metagenome]
MHHFDTAFGVGGEGTEREQGGEGNRGSEAESRIHRSTFLVVMPGKSSACIAWSLIRVPAAPGNEAMRECHRLVTLRASALARLGANGKVGNSTA